MATPVYRVSFFKTVPDSTGHLHKCLQGCIEVHADSAEQATERARTQFQTRHKISNWSLRADSETVERLEGRKRIAANVWERSQDDSVSAPRKHEAAPGESSGDGTAP